MERRIKMKECKQCGKNYDRKSDFCSEKCHQAWYYQQNKEKLNKDHKNWYEETKENRKDYIKKQNKKYRRLHKTKLKEYQKQYYKDNCEKIKKYQNDRYHKMIEENMNHIPNIY